MERTNAAEDKEVACREDRPRRGAGPVQRGCQAAAVLRDWGDPMTMRPRARYRQSPIDNPQGPRSKVGLQEGSHLLMTPQWKATEIATCLEAAFQMDRCLMHSLVIPGGLGQHWNRGKGGAECVPCFPEEGGAVSVGHGLRLLKRSVCAVRRGLAPSRRTWGPAPLTARSARHHRARVLASAVALSWEARGLEH